MPATRPEAISDSIRLAYEFAAPVRAFIPKYGAVDALLAAVVDEFPPDEERVGRLGAEDDLLTWPHEDAARATVGVAAAGVVPLVECEAIEVAILRQPPQRRLTRSVAAAGHCRLAHTRDRKTPGRSQSR